LFAKANHENVLQDTIFVQLMLTVTSINAVTTIGFAGQLSYQHCNVETSTLPWIFHVDFSTWKFQQGVFNMKIST
jgi:hypothetical protein